MDLQPFVWLLCGVKQTAAIPDFYNRFVPKSELGEVLLSGSENFSCRCVEPYTGKSTVS